MDIHNAGGGIHYTVEHTRRASEDELYGLLRERLIRMSKSGEVDQFLSFFFLTFPFQRQIQFNSITLLLTHLLALPSLLLSPEFSGKREKRGDGWL